MSWQVVKRLDEGWDLEPDGHHIQGKDAEIVMAEVRWSPSLPIRFPQQGTRWMRELDGSGTIYRPGVPLPPPEQRPPSLESEWSARSRVLLFRWAEMGIEIPWREGQHPKDAIIEWAKATALDTSLPMV